METCKEIWGSWPGTGPNAQNCDEYPFKTTQEGAGKGDKRYSARVIDGKHNSTAGSRYNAWFGEDRVINGDGFWVQIDV